jgi:acylphosphatase
VFFRATCREVASSIGVSGWVSNEPDGSVHAVFEGDESAVERMVAWCHEGPAQAHVTDVTVHEEEARGERGFKAR